MTTAADRCARRRPGRRTGGARPTSAPHSCARPATAPRCRASRRAVVHARPGGRPGRGWSSPRRASARPARAAPAGRPGQRARCGTAEASVDRKVSGMRRTPRRVDEYTLRRGSASSGRRFVTSRASSRSRSAAARSTATMTVASRLGARAGHRPGHRPGVRAGPDHGRRAARSPRWPSSGVAVLKAAGIVARRLGAGIMQYRLQARYRGRVTRQYLRLPAVLAPAPPDRAAAVQRQRRRRGDLVPDRTAADGRRRAGHARGRRRRAGAHRPGAGADRLPRVPGDLRDQRGLPAAALAARDPGPAAAGRGQRGRPRVLRRRAGREDARAGSRRRPSGSRSRPGSCATPRSQVGRVRGVFDPALEALPSLGRAGRAARRRAADAVRRGRRRRARPGRLPVHAARVPGAGDRLGARRAAAQRGRLGPGVARAGRDGRPDLRGPPAAPATAGPPHSSYAMSASATTTEDVLHGVSFDVAAGRTVALVGPTGSGKSTLTDAARPPGRPDARARSSSTASTCASVPEGGVAAVAAVVPQQTFLFDDTVRGNVTLGLDLDDAEVWSALAGRAGRPVRGEPAGRAGHPHRGARHVALGRAAPAARAGPGDRAGAAAARARRRDLVRRPPGGGGDPGRPARRVRTAATRRPSWWSPTARPPSRWPTRWSTSSTAGCSTAARTTS